VQGLLAHPQEEPMKKTKQSRAAGVGTTNEKRAEDALIDQGYNHTWRVRRTRFGNMDFMGLFDVVALKNDEVRVPIMKFVQVKTNRVDKKTIEAIKAFRVPPWCFKEVWVWMSEEKQWKITYC